MNIPDLDAYNELPDRVLMNTKELALILKCATGSIHYFINKGSIPKPVFFAKKGFGIKKPRPQWSLGQLRKLRDEMIECEVKS